jgi:hypothetical protein
MLIVGIDVGKTSLDLAATVPTTRPETNHATNRAPLSLSRGGKGGGNHRGMTGPIRRRTGHTAVCPYISSAIPRSRSALEFDDKTVQSERGGDGRGYS